MIRLGGMRPSVLRTERQRRRTGPAPYICAAPNVGLGPRPQPVPLPFPCHSPADALPLPYALEDGIGVVDCTGIFGPKLA